MQPRIPPADLTPRQVEILCALLDGGSNRQIAARLGVREQTIKNQLSVMYEKLGVPARPRWRFNRRPPAQGRGSLQGR